MKKVMLAAVVSFGLLAAASAQVNFDQGVNMDNFVSQAVSSDLVVPAPVMGRMYTSRDCVRFTFGPSDTEQLSERVWLRSTEYVTECHTVMQPGPNGTMVPVQHCYDRPGMSWSQTAQVKVLPRKLFPWEHDTFEVCLNGPWLDIYVNEAAYKYAAARVGSYDTLFELTAQNKVAMKADENGLNFGSFSYADGKYTFTVSDKWAKEYAGEKVMVSVDLFKDNAVFFDGYKGSKDFTFDVAEGYTMTFAESELMQPETPELPDTFRAAKKYYLKWGFKRLGAISKDNFIKKGKTPVITK